MDATRQLRWYLGLGLLVLAAAPILMSALAASDPAAPAGALLPVLIGGPVSLAGAYFVVRSMLVAAEPERSARLLTIGAVIVIAGAALVLTLLAATA
ncbi:hypothetical protein [Symbioplanes lichenis]|uniref:hypothetical protein n=1 Tax=Symbioplanes lichenis TaxID=1629072 RepID=UPI002738F57C|nr:hypothetical protein [Actinoplanes lichenis]